VLENLVLLGPRGSEDAVSESAHEVPEASTDIV